MAVHADPFAFHRGAACLFYADTATLEDRWGDDQVSRVWIQGDLHAENVGCMDGQGRTVSDVDDFDEAYLGHVSWACAGSRPASRNGPGRTTRRRDPGPAQRIGNSMIIPRCGPTGRRSYSSVRIVKPIRS